MSVAKKSSMGLFINLSVMMFLLFFTWGAWFASVGIFMNQAGMAEFIGWAYSTTPIAAIITPFFMGVFADRFMNAERLQGILLILSGIAIAIAPQFASAETPEIFIIILLVHALCFMPTLGLSNTICLKHLANSEKDYPIVRIFATLGWIVAGLFISRGLQADTSVIQFYVAGIAAVVVGVYSFFMPKTPPAGKGEPLSVGDIFGVQTFPYFRKPAFAFFIIASFLAAIAMMPYWANGGTFLAESGIKGAAGFLTYGQMAELVVLAFILPVFIRKFGLKWTMIIGMSCWVIRYVLFSFAAGGMAEGGLVAGQLTEPSSAAFPLLFGAVILHGFAYDFVFISGYLYVDKNVGENVRAQAQGLLTVVTQGIGFLISSQLFAGYLYNKAMTDGSSFSAWKGFWLIPAGYLVVVLVLFCLLFRPKKADL